MNRDLACVNCISLQYAHKCGYIGWFEISARSGGILKYSEKLFLNHDLNYHRTHGP